MKLTAKDIAWGPLREKLKEITGQDIQLNEEIREEKNGDYVRIRSQNLGPALGIQGLFSELQITNFGGSIDAEEGVVYLPLNFSWTCAISRGGNGTGIMTAIYYSKEKRWKFNL